MPRITKSHKCENATCTNIASKDKYGNYKRYCSNECKKISTKSKFANTYANKDMDAILEKRKATNVEKYGVDNVAKTPAVKAQLKITTAATSSVRTAKTKATNLLNKNILY